MNPTLYEFDHSLQKAYTNTLEWLDDIAEAQGLTVYLNTRQELRTLSNRLNQDDVERLYSQIKQCCFSEDLSDEQLFDSAACQYYSYFPVHYFKVKHTLSQVIGTEELVLRLRNNPNLAVIDIGCGAGAASVAFILVVRDLVISKQLTTPISILCVGSDPNFGATLIYHKLLQEIAFEVSDIGIAIQVAPFDGGIPNDNAEIISVLDTYRHQRQTPLLSQVFLMQVNIVSPLSMVHSEKAKKQAIRKKLGLASLNNASLFGEREARAYQILFSTAPIDYMHVITVGTDHHMLPKKVQEMEQAIIHIFEGSRHDVRTLSCDAQTFEYRNAANSFWHDCRKRSKRTLPNPFHVSICTLTNSDLLDDQQWKRIIDPKNMETAWAKVRRGLLRESLFDEVEIRLFDVDFEANLERLTEQLNAYAYRFTSLLNYSFPKNIEQTRPRSLTRMEEEVLSVAIIQQLGNRISALRGRSYAYRISTASESEYLYEPWWRSFPKFLKDARGAAERNPQASIIRTDIASFYTEIVQNRLQDIAQETLALSERVHWLLKLLLSRDIDVHHVGKGLTQGGIGSGFYANIYLTELDEVFGENNPWNVEFFRYVDDMILIIPDPAEVNAVEEKLRAVLTSLNLTLNEQKTQKFERLQDFLTNINTEIDDPILDNDQYDAVIDSLWLMNQEYRQYFRERFDESNDLWWSSLEDYRNCLTELGIYITSADLSRRLYRILFNPHRYQETLNRSMQLNFPSLPIGGSIHEYQNWRKEFVDSNVPWVEKLDGLREEYSQLFQKSWKDLQNIDGLSNLEEKQRQRWLRFASNRLIFLGLYPAIDSLVHILCTEPWRIREPIYTIEHMARQGYFNAVKRILHHFEDKDYPMSEYLRAVCLRAFRYVPMQIDFPWELIALYAVEGSIVERLMATETWLFLDPTKPPIREEHLSRIWSETSLNADLPERLTRNYLLILSRYTDVTTLEALIKDVVSVGSADYTLHAVANSIHAGNRITLFDYEEPAKIRRRYYGTREEYDETSPEHDT